MHTFTRIGLTLGLLAIVRLATAQGAYPSSSDTIIIKFAEGSMVRMAPGLLQPQFFSKVQNNPAILKIKDTVISTDEIAKDLSTISDIFTRAGDVKASKLFPRPDTFYEQEKSMLDARLAEREQRAPNPGPGITPQRVPDMNLYYILHITYKQGMTREKFLSQLDSNRLIEKAYPKYHAESPTCLSASPSSPDSSPISTPLFSRSQGYLYQAPSGINAPYAWKIPGGMGTNIRLIDIEQNWDSLHEDLSRPFVRRGNRAVNSPQDPNHGTAVLGEMLGLHNPIGVDGICPAAGYGLMAVNDTFLVSQGIAQATELLEPGDVILIEQHAKGPDVPGGVSVCNAAQFEYLPMEYWSDCRDAIVRATAKGIIVVEAAGNGQMNLDDPIYQNVFDPNAPYASGAIMVAADGGGDRNPACWTNYGKRINFFAWGDHVISTGYGDLYNPGNNHRIYTNTFAGTSSASPIIAGLIVVIQGIRRQAGKPLWQAADFTRFMRGTPQSPNTGKPIGILPDLKATLSGMH
jgi:serine protease